MEQRTLKNTGLSVSRLCCGTMTFGGQTGEAAAREMVSACLDHGINFFDTANVYTAGASETILGRALKGRRDKVVLATKVAARMGPGPDQGGLSRAAILRQAEESLQRLGTDHVDLFYLHWPDPSVPLEESLGALDELVRSGKARQVAASNYASWQMTRMLWIAESRSLPRMVAAQVMYNPLSRGIEQELLPACRELGIASIAYNPLAGGILTGKQKFEAPEPGTRFDQNQAYLDRYWHEANFSAVQELAALAQAAGRSLISLVFGWMLHHSPIDCVVIGASKPAHLHENLRAAGEGPLPPEAVAGIDRIWQKLRGPAPRYNR